jgi:hypothetical protein
LLNAKGETGPTNRQHPTDPSGEGYFAHRRQAGQAPAPPKSLDAHRAFDSLPHRIQLRWCRIEPRIAIRGEPYSSGLGRHRWVVQPTLSWRHQYNRLPVRYENRVDIHEAFITLCCALICGKRPKSGYCWRL